MKKFITISLISTIFTAFVGCSRNEPIYEGEGAETSDEEQQKVRDIIDADQEKLNEESKFEEGEISEEAQQEIQDIIDADQADLNK